MALEGVALRGICTKPQSQTIINQQKQFKEQYQDIFFFPFKSYNDSNGSAAVAMTC